MGKRKFTINVVLIAIVVAIALVGCGKADEKSQNGAGDNGLTSAFDKGLIESKAKEVVNVINAKDTVTLRNMCDDVMKAALDDETVEKVYSGVGEAGDFVDFGDFQIQGNKDGKTGKDYGVIVIKCQYSKKALIYTISFDQDMNLAGIYYK